MAERLELLEYQSRTFDSSAFVRDGRIELNPEAQTKGGVALRWGKGNLELQAGGVIGVIPLNDELILEVRTRVPVARVEEIVRRSGSKSFVSLSHDREFAVTSRDFVKVDDLIAARFGSVLEELSFEGLYKTYERRADRGSSPQGRILPAETTVSLHTSARPEAHFQHFVRTVDNEVNRLLLAAGHLLAAAQGGPRTRARQLSQRLQMFDGVRRIPERGPWHVGTLPDNRPVLVQAVELARLILLRAGVRFFGEGNVTLPSFLINMEEVFESYVRSVLDGSLALALIEVLDGNLKPPSGAASEIFETAGPLGNHQTKPDFVLRRDEAILCVGDVKYKPCPKQPERAHLEQVLVYGLAYRSPKALIVYPCAAGQATSIEFLGEVGGIRCYKATLQLMNERLDDEELHFCNILAELLQN